MIFERAYCPFGGIDTVIVWFNQLKGGTAVGDGPFDCSGGFIVEDIEAGFASPCGEGVI
jgi:hypothetical protein